MRQCPLEEILIKFKCEDFTHCKHLLLPHRRWLFFFCLKGVSMFLSHSYFPQCWQTSESLLLNYLLTDWCCTTRLHWRDEIDVKLDHHGFIRILSLIAWVSFRCLFCFLSFHTVPRPDCWTAPELVVFPTGSSISTMNLCRSISMTYRFLVTWKTFYTVFFWFVCGEGSHWFQTSSIFTNAGSNCVL